MYGYMRDNYMRPILIVNLQAFVHSDMDDAQLLDTMLLHSYYTVHHAMIPGKIETMINIIDAKDLSLF